MKLITSLQDEALMVLANSPYDVAGLELLKPVFAANSLVLSGALLEILLWLLQGLQILSGDVDNLARLGQEGRIFAILLELAAFGSERGSFEARREDLGWLRSDISLAALKAVRVVRKGPVAAIAWCVLGKARFLALSTPTLPHQVVRVVPLDLARCCVSWVSRLVWLSRLYLQASPWGALVGLRG